MKTKVLIIAVFVCAFALITAGRGWADGDRNAPAEKSKILKFSHQKHIDAGTECATCHASVMNSELAADKNIPGHDVCQSCHQEEVNAKCDFCHVGSEPGPLPNPVREIRFNHKNHITGQKLECATCHTGLDKVEYASAVNLPSMTTCTACHNNIKANNHCETCHTNLASLRPASHGAAGFFKEHAHLTRLNTMEAQCANCHNDNFCAQCHDGSNLIKLSPKEKIGMVSPRTIGNDKPLALAGQMVHDLNYRFTHGIDAKGRSADCQVCHREQNFCNDCHRDGSQALGGVVPTSHEGAGFTTLGYGSGGGRHAVLAKRDIQSCASCHDPEGNDPNCIKCHVDPDGVKHTNPRTHPSGFMSNVSGDWMTDASSVCFTCHIDPSAKPKPVGKAGVGFCGYCHGKK
jgi:hypothetical protein